VKRLDDLKLPQNVSDALRAAQEQLTKEFNIDRILLFGSIVRGAASEGSDEDLLIVLAEPASHRNRDRISSMILDLNLAHGTNLSELIVDRDTWDHGIPSALPIHKIIEEEGVSL